MNNVNINQIVVDLTPIDGHMSFYGKAKVVSTPTATYLKSYDTVVASISKRDLSVHRHWNGWSRTTARHIASFLGRCSPTVKTVKEFYEIAVTPGPSGLYA